VFDLGHLSPSIRWRRAGGGGVSPAFQTDFTAISSLPTGISLTRATTGTYFNASGVLQTAAIDAPRFDHNPVSPFAATGLLIEEQRTNSLLQSNNFSNAAWIKAGSATIGASANLSPDGTTNASTLTLSAAFGSYVYQDLGTNLSNPNVPAIFARVTSGTGKVYLSVFNDTTLWPGADVLTCNLTTSWQRFPVPRSATSRYFVIGNTDAAASTPHNDASAVVEIYGAQLEAGSFATSYIPTTSASVPRSADVPSSSSPLTGYLAAGPSVWEFQDEATGTIARSAYAAGAFNWPVDKWYRSMGVYPSGTDTSGHMTVGSSY
jgi:hypothetical protein